MTPPGRIAAFFRSVLSPDIVRALIYSKTTLVSQCLGLITISVIISYLGNENFGVYQYALGVIGTALLVGHLGTDAVAFRELSLPLRHACGALPRILLVRLIGILASLAIMWGLIHFGILHLSKGLFLAVAATAVSESFLRIGVCWHRARHLAWADFWTTNGRALAVLLLVLLIVPHHPDARGIALAYGLGAFLILVSLLWQWRRILRVGWKAGFKWRGVLSLSFTYLDTAGNFIGTIPILLLGHYDMFAEIGRFSVYYKYLFPFALAATLCVQSLQPSLVQAFSRGTPPGSMIRRGVKLVLGAGALGLFGSLTVGSLFVIYLGHQRPLDLPMLAVLAVLPAIFGIASLVDSVLKAARQEHLLVVSRTVGICTCFLVSLLLWRVGGIAAATAISATFLLESACGTLLAIRSFSRGTRRNAPQP